MQVLVWDGPKLLRAAEAADPVAGPGEVVVRARAAGVCGSEVEGYLGRQANRTPPLIMGHELAGVVVAAGESSDPSLPGQTVAVNPIVSCRSCRYCRTGARNLCRGKELIGIARPGGFAELVAVPAANLTRLPAGTDARLGAFVEPMANGVHAARLALSGREADGPVRAVVIGGGAIGLCVLQALRMSMAGTVDVLEPSPYRREMAARFGAAAVHAAADDARQALGAGQGPRRDDTAGADVVVDAVGSQQARQLAVDLARPHGRVVLIGMHDDETTLAFRPVVRNEIVLAGSYAYTDDDFARAAQWLVTGQVSPGDIEPIRPLADGPEVFAAIAAGGLRPVRAFLGNG